jgi:CyaY protein
LGFEPVLGISVQRPVWSAGHLIPSPPALRASPSSAVRIRSTPKTIEEPRFRQIVASALKDLWKQVDGIESDDLDAKLTEGVFQVDFESGGVFVLSQQVPVRELWLSAFSKAWHFRWAEGAWRERDSGEPLEKVLSELFTRKMGQRVAIANPGPTA